MTTVYDYSIWLQYDYSIWLQYMTINRRLVMSWLGINSTVSFEWVFFYCGNFAKELCALIDKCYSRSVGLFCFFLLIGTLNIAPGKSLPDPPLSSANAPRYL